MWGDEEKYIIYSAYIHIQSSGNLASLALLLELLIDRDQNQLLPAAPAIDHDVTLGFCENIADALYSLNCERLPPIAIIVCRFLLLIRGMLRRTNYVFYMNLTQKSPRRVLQNHKSAKNEGNMKSWRE